ncbi:MAG: ABC transporter permease, partial [Bacillus sp. (in: firmicutes)]
MLPLNNFFIILMHTYLTKLKTKSFLVTSLITVAIIVALTNLPNIIEYFNKNDEEKIAIVDETGGQLFETLKQQVKAVN